MNNNQNTWAQQHRQLRLFISSTFVDMDAERNALTRIFPQISEMCRQHGVEFVPLDLRWGITEDEAKEGRVIETCLREIDNSRPFFIGIIGNRYGWVPEKKDLGNFSDTIQERYPWINKALDLRMSITEMEMQHAVLMRKDNKGMNAAFYLRSPSMSVDASFKEIPGSAGERKLNELKSVVRNQKDFPARDYNSVDELAQMVLQDVESFLYRVFPKQKLESYEQMAVSQERLLNERSDSLFSLVRYQIDINKWVENKEKRDLLITGRVGVGKSYLMAEIVSQLRKKGEKLVYIDISEQEKLTDAFEYVCGELLFQMGVKSRKQNEKESNIGCFFSFIWMFIKFLFIGLTLPFRAAFGKQGAAEQHLKNKVSEITQSYASNTFVDAVKRLRKALRKHPEMRLYVVLDNLDDLTGDDLSIFTLFDDTDQIRIVASASLDSNTQLYLQNRKTTEVLQVKNLNVNQATNYMNRFLAKYGKSLDARGEQCGKLLKMGVAGNPLLLSHVLELMVRFGSYEELDNYINELSTIKNETELYILMLRHILKQFESSSQFDLIKDIVAAFAVVKGGLSESEIKKIFNPKEIVWALFEPYLRSISRTKGNLLKPASVICRNVILNEMKDRIPAVAAKVAAYFEDTLHCSVEHIDSMGTLDGQAYVSDAELLNRQVQVLPELYFERDKIDDLYYWLTYIKCDLRLNDEQRYRYWKKLYAAGIHLRQAGDIDIPPYVARMSIRIQTGSVDKRLLKDNPALKRMFNSYYNHYKWLRSDNEDLNNLYNRWNGVAGFYCDAEDMKWLMVKSRMVGGVQGDVNEANLITSLAGAIADKEWDKAIALGRSAIVNEQTRVFVNMFMGFAYEGKGEMQTAYELAKSNVALLQSVGLEHTPDALVIIYQFVKQACRYGTMEEVEKGHSLILLHEETDHTRNLSDKNSLLFHEAMARVNLRKGNKEAAIRYAQVFGKICISMGGSDKNAQDIIDKANELN